MWYVIQTFCGEEEKTANLIRKVAPSDLLEECFIPKRERIKKFHGCWNKEEEILFPGYVFVITESPRRMYEELKKIPKMTKVLGREEDWFLALGDREEKFVRMIGGKERKVGLSKVMIEEGKTIYVMNGPLKGYEGNVVKVNLHKREVDVKVEFLGREIVVKMGIEMVNKENG